MTDRINESLMDRRTPMMLALLFAEVALFLAAIGLYGVLAYQVAQRRKEIGIRMALGSEPGGIFALVLQEGAALLVAGLAVGACRRVRDQAGDGNAALRRQRDGPAVLASVAGLLAVVAVAACIVPARRASRINPMLALSE